MVFVGDLAADNSVQTEAIYQVRMLVLEAINRIRCVHMSTKDLVVSKDTTTVTKKVGETRPGY